MDQTNENDADLKALAKRAAAIVADLPADLRPAAYGEVYRTLVEENLVGRQLTNPPRRRKVVGKATKATSKKPAAGKSSSRKRTRRTSPSLDKTLNLRPKGKQSLKDFFDEKKPKGQDEMNAVFVFYLASELGQAHATYNQIYTSYKEVGVRVPANIANSLAVTASRKGWVDTETGDEIALTPGGENLVIHDLPREEKT
jgi:hypothetical protein